MTKLFRITLSLIIISTLSPACLAQEIDVEGIIKGKNLHSSLLLIHPMGSNRNDTLHIESLSNDQTEYRITGKTRQAADSLYMLMGVVDESQLLRPLRIEPEKTFHLNMTDNGWECDDTDDNRALSAFSRTNAEISRALWELDKNSSTDDIIKLLGDYYRQATAITLSSACRQTTAEYIRLWAYTAMKSQYNSLPFITKRKDILQDISAGNEMLWPGGYGAKPQEMLDNTMALYFYQTPQIITATLPRGSMRLQLQALYDTYHCPEIREKVTELLLGRYISHFDYANHYAEGLETIRQICNEYHLDDQFLKQFMMRRYSSPGSLFPEEVVLVDSIGNKIDFSTFHGKYVYIDLWASWCKPCIGEIPYLQQMEKEMSKRDDLVFVSVSIDQSKTAWKRKMKELQLHGHQLLDEGGKISRYLNINSIPFFLIYDKEGKLWQYGAARPSTGERLRKILENLP